jgi:anti-anti-sigma factor
LERLAWVQFERVAVLEIARMEEPRGLRLVGELDLANVDEFSALLEPQVKGGGEIVLDVSQLRFMGSSGVQVIIRALLDLEDRGRLILDRPGYSLRRLIEVMGLQRFDNLDIRE